VPPAEAAATATAAAATAAVAAVAAGGAGLISRLLGDDLCGLSRQGVTPTDSAHGSVGFAAHGTALRGAPSPLACPEKPSLPLAGSRRWTCNTTRSSFGMHTPRTPPPVSLDTPVSHLPGAPR
jgi:hypothetical protein